MTFIFGIYFCNREGALEEEFWSLNLRNGMAQGVACRKEGKERPENAVKQVRSFKAKKP